MATHDNRVSSMVLRQRCANRGRAGPKLHLLRPEGKYNPMYPASDRSTSLTPTTWLSFSLHEIIHVFLQVREP
jgi:hypothetical protein